MIFKNDDCQANVSYHWNILGLQFKPEEINAIMKDFEEPGLLAPTGLFLGGTKYMVIQGEAGAVIRGKKVQTTFWINYELRFRMT